MIILVIGDTNLANIFTKLLYFSLWFADLKSIFKNHSFILLNFDKEKTFNMNKNTFAEEKFSRKAKLNMSRILLILSWLYLYDKSRKKG